MTAAARTDVRPAYTAALREKPMKIISTTLAMLPVLAGCVALLGPELRNGQTEADLVAQLGPPTARYVLPAGQTRLEFARGPFGRHTWMVDLDAGGRSVRHEQVLNEARFAAFQQQAPGMSREELLRTLGTPGERRHGGRMGGELWSWRYPTNDCLLFEVLVGDDRRVVSGGYNIDLRCDARGDRD